MRIIVTGGAGFIGSHVGRNLLEAGHNVLFLDNLSGGERRNLPKDAALVEMDIRDPSGIDGLFQRFQPDAVYHLAAYAAEGLSHNIRRFIVSNNIEGSSNVINACINHNVKLLVFTSSIAVYGSIVPPFTEDMDPRPEDPYGLAKLYTENDIKLAHEFFGGLNYVNVRLQNVIGTNQNTADRYRNVVSIFLRHAMEGRPLPIFGDGMQTRAFTPVSHVAAVMGAIVERPASWNQTFNVGYSETVKVIEMGRMICKLLGVPDKFHFNECRKETVHAFMSHARCDDLFSDIYPSETLENVLMSMIEQCKQRSFGTIQKGPDIEIETGLPLAWTS